MIITINIDQEVFKPLIYPGVIPGRYEISNYGNIFDKETALFKKTSANSRNYILVKLLTTEGMKTISVHRLVAYNFVEGYDEATNRVVVNHEDSDTHNNYYENLKWTTYSENNFHRFEHGLGSTAKPPISFGKDHHNNVHDDQYIETICSYLEETKSVIKTMRKLGYAKQNDNKKLYNLIYDIKKKRVWVQISNKYNLE